MISASRSMVQTLLMMKMGVSLFCCPICIFTSPSIMIHPLIWIVASGPKRFISLPLIFRELMGMGFFFYHFGRINDPFM